jgi:hypothetical protein
MAENPQERERAAVAFCGSARRFRRQQFRWGDFHRLRHGSKFQIFGQDRLDRIAGDFSGH